MCRSAVKGTILDGGSRPCAETLRLALGCGATGRAAAPAPAEPCDLLPNDERPQSSHLRMGCPAEGIL